MENLLSLISFDNDGVMAAISEANDETDQYGLILSASEIKDICNVYKNALSENRIVEFGAGGVTKIQKAFAASDFVDKSNFAEIVEVMTEMFYFIKREVEVEVGDDSLINAMLNAFDNHSHGSADIFCSREAKTLIRYINEGRESLEIAGEDDYDFIPEEFYENE